MTPSILMTVAALGLGVVILTSASVLSALLLLSLRGLRKYEDLVKVLATVEARLESHLEQYMAYTRRQATRDLRAGRLTTKANGQAGGTNEEEFRDDDPDVREKMLLAFENRRNRA